MVARFFLGFFEAGYGPGIPYLLSFFYLRHEIGVRIGIFLSAAPLATCFAGALAYGITSGHAAIANWRLLFLVEGLPCVAAGILTFFVLPDSPEKARFLNEEEREVARARGVRQVGAEEGHRVGGVKWSDIGAAFLDPKVPLILHLFRKVHTLMVEIELSHGLDVFLMQCLIQLPPCLPPHYPQRDGILRHQCSGLIRPTILRRVPPRHPLNLHCRSHPTTWLCDYVPLRYCLHWLHLTGTSPCPFILSNKITDILRLPLLRLVLGILGFSSLRPVSSLPLVTSSPGSSTTKAQTQSAVLASRSSI